MQLCVDINQELRDWSSMMSTGSSSCCADEATGRCGGRPIFKGGYPKSANGAGNVLGVLGFGMAACNGVESAFIETFDVTGVVGDYMWMQQCAADLNCGTA